MSAPESTPAIQRENDWPKCFTLNESSNIFEYMTVSNCTGKRRRLVVPCVASTIMSIQKLSFSRRGECSTVCFLNLWINWRFCTTDRRYLKENEETTNQCFFLTLCKTYMNNKYKYFVTWMSVPEWWLEFEELLSSLSGFRDVVS